MDILNVDTQLHNRDPEAFDALRRWRESGYNFRTSAEMYERMKALLELEASIFAHNFTRHQA